MRKQGKFDRMARLLADDNDAKAAFLHDPRETLKRLKVDSAFLDERVDKNAFERGRQVLAQARITENESAAETLKKVGEAADRVFGGGYEVDVQPLGVKLMERVPSRAADVTATGTVNCTWDPYDGCSPDVDW